MNYKIIRRWLACAALAFGAGSALAEDIDIYSQNTTITPGAPNVLIVLDNTANWSQSFSSSTKFAAEMAALSQVVNALKTQFNLGIVMFTETGSPNSTTDGGYVRFAIQGMTQTDGTASDARNCLLKMVGSGSTCTSANINYSLLDINADKSNGGKAGVTMGEVYDYFAGVNAYAGNNKVKADPLAFTSNSIVGPTYKSPITESCQKNFVIVISNGAFQDNASDTATATSQLGSAGGSTTVINPPDNGSSSNNEGDEWVRFLNKVSSIAAVTYTLEVGPSTTGQGPYNTSLLQSMGTQGKGGYFSAIDAATLNAALTRIFNDIQAVNSVFASASLPLSSDRTGAFLNQVYMGVFRPDGGGKPRWVGNVKQYAFAVDSNKNLFLVDSLGAAAAGAAGFATPDAVSFWTSKDTTTAPDAATQTSTSAANGSTNGFWFFDSKGSGGNFDSQDGEWVEKGGAAQQLRLAYLGYGGRGGVGDNNDSTLNSKPARQVLTCIGSCLTTSGTTLTTTANRATTWFEVQNTAIDSSALGLVNTITVSSITNAATTATTLTTGPSISLIHVANGNNKPATVTTSVAHGFSNGNTVVISGSNVAGYNGTWTISGVTSTTFQVGSFTGTADANAGTAAKSSSTTAFVTATAHGLTTGQKVVIAGATPTGFNNAGVATAITVLNANTFTYTVTSAVTGPATGTVTYTGPTAHVTTASAHGFANNASVTIAQVASPSVYNGTFTIRNVTSTTFDYTYSGADPIQANATTTLGITATNTTGSIRDSLVRWVRGLDTADENGFKVNSTDTDVRASIHGDVLHSRPIVLNYSGSSGSDNVYVFYGGNDGIYRAIKGGQAATDGKEQWAFIPQEFFPKFQRLYNNSPQVLYSSTPPGLTPTPTTRDYAFDGPVGSYIHRDSAGAVDKAILFIALRRGGRFLYALDVTSPTAPKFLWRKGSGDAGFAELGQTWSQPVVAKINAQANPVLIFGAGYDAASEDTDIPAVTDTQGRAIYVLDAFTGAPIWAAGKATNFGSLPSGMVFKQVDAMDFSVASDVQVIDRTLDGVADRIYAVDVGANVWRVDINDPSPGNWVVWKIASLGQRTAATANARARKLLFSPDVVFGTSFDAVIVGTGDREHPLATNSATYGVANRFYMIKDPNIGTTGADLGLTDTCTMTVGSTCSSFFDATGGDAVPTTASGWSVNLATGEKIVNGPLVTAGNVIFGTNQPDTSNTTCNANLGIARRYDVNYLTGLGAGGFKDANGNVVLSEVAVGGGFLPSPVSGVVEIGGVPYLFTTDNPLNPGGVIPLTVTVSQKRTRTYWREKLE